MIVTLIEPRVLSAAVSNASAIRSSGERCEIIVCTSSGPWRRSRSSRSVEGLALDAVVAGVRVAAAGAVPHDHEAARAIGCHGGGILVAGRERVHLDLATDGVARRRVKRAGHRGLEQHCHERDERAARLVHARQS
jgi:hypothetical protein